MAPKRKRNTSNKSYKKTSKRKSKTIKRTYKKNNTFWNLWKLANILGMQTTKKRSTSKKKQSKIKYLKTKPFTDFENKMED